MRGVDFESDPFSLLGCEGHAVRDQTRNEALRIRVLHAADSTLHQVDLVALITERRHDETTDSDQLVASVQTCDGACDQVWTTEVGKGLLARPACWRVPGVDGVIPVLVEQGDLRKRAPEDFSSWVRDLDVPSVRCHASQTLSDDCIPGIDDPFPGLHIPAKATLLKEAHRLSIRRSGLDPEWPRVVLGQIVKLSEQLGPQTLAPPLRSDIQGQPVAGRMPLTEPHRPHGHDLAVCFYDQRPTPWYISSWAMEIMEFAHRGVPGPRLLQD